MHKKRSSFAGISQVVVWTCCMITKCLSKVANVANTWIGLNQYSPMILNLRFRGYSKIATWRRNALKTSKGNACWIQKIDAFRVAKTAQKQYTHFETLWVASFILTCGQRSANIKRIKIKPCKMLACTTTV